MPLLARAAVVVMLAGAVVPDAAVAGDACVPRGARVVSDTGRAVLYLDRGSTRVIGCLRRRPRPVVLASNDPYTVWTARLAGRYAGVAINACGSQGCAPVRVDVHNLRRARRVTRSRFTEASHPLERLVALELRANGTAAFTGDSDSFDVAWVWRLRPGGRRELLDHGTPVDAQSLRRAGRTTVTWRHGAETRSAELD